MEINKQISKQLLSYSAAAAAVMVSTSVNATIRVNQDGLMLPMEVTGGFDLDFNNDGIDDLNMQLKYYGIDTTYYTVVSTRMA